MSPIRHRIIVGLISATMLVALTDQGSAGSRLTFGVPVLLTIEKGAGGFEPGITIDRFYNVFVTAPKGTATTVVSPDSRSTTKTRSQSWLWTSTDGKTFTDLAGLTPLQEQNAEFGAEGDVATDATGHLYFVDTSVVDSSFSRYRATGPGKVLLETTRPIGPFAQPIDDRPWVAAHGDGVVLYLANGSYASIPLGRQDGGAYGQGRNTAYMSYNHGDTFDPIGTTLNDSGNCRPAADKRAGSKRLYVLCANDHGTLWSFVSVDDGHNWQRYRMGEYNRSDAISAWPSVSVARNGTVYALYNESITDSSGQPTKGNLRLFTSRDNGKNWTDRSITPAPGIYQHTWLDVAPDGTLGIGYYYRPNRGSDWYVWAATSRDGRHFAAAQVARQRIADRRTVAPGDFFQIAFGPDAKLSVVWTSSINADLYFESANRDVFYARQK